MKSNMLIGRLAECERLDECMEAMQAQLVIVYGRRRVGKTYIINEYFHNDFALKITGAYGSSKEIQLKNFTAALNRKTGKNDTPPDSWFDAFERLRDYIETLDEDKKQVFFFDEMPWLDTRKSGFLAAFEWFWNDWGSARKNLFFIVCGSATSWMDEKIANNRGGLFNRQTCKLCLLPFNLHDTEEYLRFRNISWSRYDIIRCYMIMGGIPYYLSLLSNRLSLSQNIDRLFFKAEGELRNEFFHLYRTLFANCEQYIKVAEVLSTKRGGLSREELISVIGKPSGGDLSKVLNNLVLSGFVRVTGFYGRKKKNALYQLCDYYSSFYFRFVRNNYGQDDHYWSNTEENPSRKAWEGLVFEQVCRDHITAVKHKLGISGVLTEASSWFIRGNSDEGISGAQIDLLLDRRDHVINACEIKFAGSEFEITKDYDLRLRNKVETFRQAEKIKDTIQLVMITTYGLKKNQYSSVIQNQVTMDDLFVP